MPTDNPELAERPRPEPTDSPADLVLDWLAGIRLRELVLLWLAVSAMELLTEPGFSPRSQIGLGHRTAGYSVAAAAETSLAWLSCWRIDMDDGRHAADPQLLMLRRPSPLVVAGVDLHIAKTQRIHDPAHDRDILDPAR